MIRSTPQNLEILYEDNHFIAINKKSGDIIQGDKTNDTPLSDILKTYLKHKYNKPGNVFLGVIHRLDRPVSGVTLFAKTSKGLSKANRLFADKNVQKTYLSIVQNIPPKTKEQLSNWILRNPKQNKSYIHPHEIPNSKSCTLEYQLIQQSKHYYLLEIDLKTGRHHQIRAQLSHIGCPIKGDLKYNAKRSNKDGSICLHANKLSFEHPIKKKMVHIIAPTPSNNLWDSFKV